jgi:hypothetical protein
MLESEQGQRIQELLDGNTDGYGGDQSRADMALCSHLAFWYRKDCGTIDRIFRGSGLYREKWDTIHHADGSTYGEETIRRAIESCENTYKQPKDESVTSEDIVWDPNDIDMSYYLQEPQPVRWIVPGLLEHGIIGTVCGEGGTTRQSQALLLLTIFLAIAPRFKHIWLGKYPIPECKKTLYLSLEDGEIHIQRRFKAIMARLFLNEHDRKEAMELFVKNVKIITPFYFNKNSNFEKLCDMNGDPTNKYYALVDFCEKFLPDLVIVDTKSKAAAVSENDNNLNSAFVELMAQLTNGASNVTVLLSMHVSKAARSGKGGGAYMSRGASSIMDDARWRMAIIALNKTDSNGNDLLKITHEKASYSKCNLPFVVSCDYPLLLLSTDPIIDADDNSNLSAQIIEVIKGYPEGLSRTKVRALVKKNATQVRVVIETLIKAGILEELKGGGRGTKVSWVQRKADDALNPSRLNPSNLVRDE